MQVKIVLKLLVLGVLSILLLIALSSIGGIAGERKGRLHEVQQNIAESYAGMENGELWLINSHIPKYDQAKTFQHEERRRRKLLVSKRELSKLWAEVGRQGMTLVPLKIYFNDKGRAKLLLGIAKGKQKQDKRASEKNQDWKRQQSRLLRDRG